ncbi:hypothetical protein EW026_g5595, partial [Hermanssonia centrifuga]
KSQDYLVKVVEPYRTTLASLWIGSLRDYASIRAGIELLDDTSAVDSSFSSLGKEVLLPYYRDSWSITLQAVTSAMESGDPAIRVAMDGGDPTSTDSEPTLNGGTASEHTTAFFFVIFGLVFEALVTSTPDTGTQNVRTSIVALKALNCLVQNKYAGDAFCDLTIFEEVVNLCYRMALTEPIAVQTYLVDTLASLAHNVARNYGTKAEKEYSAPPQTHCLRICAYVLKRVIGNPRDAAAQILKDEISEVDLVGPSLKSLKKLLETLPESPGDQVKFEKMVHGILSACLVNIDAMRGREGPACQKKIKSNLLATVLVLTVVPPSIKISISVIEHSCFLISQKLIEPDEMSITAAHCAKTLIIASTLGNRSLRNCVKLLLPGMIECIAKIVAGDENETPDLRTQIVGEIWKAFSALFSSTPEDLREPPSSFGLIAYDDYAT